MKEKLKKFVESFNFLEPKEIETVVDYTVLKKFKKGQILLKEGEVANACYAVIEGCVREYYIIDGLEKTTAFFTEGQAVNSFSSATNKKPSKHFLECSEDCILTVGNEGLVEGICKLIPRMEKFIRTEVERSTGELQDRLAEYIISSPEERFKKLLENNNGIMNRVPQHQIASYLGVTPESLSRIKKRVFKK